jgi:UPF0716 family protein affecting phage T7 exclusion
VHDIYSFALGLSLWATLAYTSERLYRAYKAGRLHGLGELSREECLAMVRRASSDAAHLAFFAVLFGGVVPLLTAVTLHIYLFVPFMNMGDAVPTVWVAQDWAYGVLWASMAIRLARVMPTSWLSARLEEIDAARQQGSRQGLRTANRVLVSVTLRLAAMVIVPGLFSWALTLALSTSGAKRLILTLMQRLPLPIAAAGELELPPPMVVTKVVYASCWCALLNRWCGEKLGVWIQGWIGKVRDEEFLVERRLRDLDEVEGEGRVD